jgi:AsmA protein
MKKLIKYLALTFVTVFALIAAVLIYAKLFVDPNDYRTEIAAQASKSIGRELVIDGDLSLSVFPWIGIEIGRVSVGNANGFDGDFATVDNAGAAVRLLPLLSGNLQVSRVVLDGLQANLQVKANGNNNWSDLGEQGSADDRSGADDVKQRGSGLQSFSIEGVDISNSQLSYVDQQNGQDIVIREINLSADNISSGQAFDLDGGLLYNNVSAQLSYELQLDGQLKFDQAAGQLDFEQLQAVLSDRGDDPLPALALTLNGMFNSQSETLELNPLQLETGDLQLTANVQGSSVLSAPAINGSAELAQFNPKKLAKTFNIELPQLRSDDALQKASAELKFNATADRVQISNLHALLDDSTIDGRLTATMGNAASNYVFNLQLDQINLDNYMPAEPASDEPMPPIAVEMFRSINARGDVGIGQLTINQLDMTDIQVSINADRGGWRLQPITAKFYDGTLAGGVNIDASGRSPQLSTTGNLDQVLAGAMLADVAGRDLLTGIANFDSDLRMDMNNPTQTLSGELVLGINDGALKGVDIVGMMRQGLSLADNLSGGKIGGAELLQASGDTRFASLSGRFLATNGVIRNNDFKLVSPLLNVLGEGVIDLASDQIDYTVTASLLQAPEGGAETKLGKMLGKSVPIRIRGSLSKPAYSIDPQLLLNILAGDKLQQQKGKLLDKLRGEDNEAGDGSTRSAAADVLGGLLDGRSKQAPATADENADSVSDNDEVEADNADAANSEQAEQPESSSEAAAGALIKGLFKKKKPAEQEDKSSDENADDDDNVE